MKTLKKQIISELESIEHKAAVSLTNDLSAATLDKVYKLSKTLHYLEKACEVIANDGKAMEKM